MKILYLHQYFLEPSDRGGTRSWELARRLAAAGHEVAIVTSDRAVDRRSWTVEHKAGFEIHRVGVRYANTLSYSERIAAFLRFAAAAGTRARKLGGDLVFATSTPLTIALPGIFAARALRVPFVFEVRDLWPAVPIALGALRNPATIAAARALERLAYRESAHVIALSPGMRDGVIAGGVDPSRVSVIPNACDFELFEVPAESGQRWRSEQPWLVDQLGDRPLLVYAGTFGLVNGAAWLAEVAHALEQRGSRVCIALVGDGREQSMIHDRARALGVLDRNFFMLDPVPKTEMPALLSAASGAVSTVIDSPALRDNSANKFFDALAASRPVFINHDGWLADLIRERECGSVLPRDPRAAAATLAKHLEDPAWVKRAGANAAALGRERFDRNDHAAELEAVLTGAVRARSRTGRARA